MVKKKSAAKKPASRSPQRKPQAGPTWPAEGSKAPDFTAIIHDGTTIRLSDFKGRPVVLYFYPKDDTPGCTTEACGFRDSHASFAKHKAVILGVSPDSPERHEKFRSKYRLPFTLIADEDHAIAKTYGAWRQKSLYGRTFMGIVRSTFLIDESGKIAKVFAAVKPAIHDAEVLAILGELHR